MKTLLLLSFPLHLCVVIFMDMSRLNCVQPAAPDKNTQGATKAKQQTINNENIHFLASVWNEIRHFVIYFTTEKKTRRRRNKRKRMRWEKRNKIPVSSSPMKKVIRWQKERKRIRERRRIWKRKERERDREWGRSPEMSPDKHQREG